MCKSFEYNTENASRVSHVYKERDREDDGDGRRGSKDLGLLMYISLFVQVQSVAQGKSRRTHHICRFGCVCSYEMER